MVVMMMIAVLAVYLLIWAVAWMVLQPFVGTLEILALGLC